MQVHLFSALILICHGNLFPSMHKRCGSIAGTPHDSVDLSRNFGSYESPVVRAAAALVIPKIGDMPDPCKSSCLGEPRLDVRRQIDRNSVCKTS